MPGTRLGGLKARDTNIARHGENFYSNLGKIGGACRGNKGFACMPKWKVIEAGRKGGLASKKPRS